MQQILFTVYDEKAEAFLPPFFVPSIGIAIRAFADCINSPEHMFGKHPADYTLYSLGHWHDHDASFDLGDRKSMGNGVEFRNPNPPDGANGSDKQSIQSNETSGDSAV